MNIIKPISPGTFSMEIAADRRRGEFDYKNGVILTNKVPVDFVFIGDSITHNWELNAFFSNRGNIILNRGIGGDTSEYLLKRFEADALQLKPNYCIMLIGANDSWVLEPEASYIRDVLASLCSKKYPYIGADMLINRVIGKIAAIVDMAMECGQKMILCSILPTNLPGLISNQERNKCIKEINTRIETLSKDKGLIFVDYHSEFVQSDGVSLKEGLTEEGLHPHAIGYNIMADVLRKTLKENGIEI